MHNKGQFGKSLGHHRASKAPKAPPTPHLKGSPRVKVQGCPLSCLNFASSQCHDSWCAHRIHMVGTSLNILLKSLTVL